MNGNIWDSDPELRAEAQRQQQRYRRRQQGNGLDGENVAPLGFTIGSTLAGREPPTVPWMVPDWIPRRQVTLLSGDGGTGKTRLALQLMFGAAYTGDWLGLPVMRCRAWGLFAEDDDDEIERVLHTIAKDDLANLCDLAWRSAVIDPCELVDIDSDGRVQPTEYFWRLRKAILDFGARLVVLDAATNLYGGDELKRRQVNGFITLLRKLAIEIDGAVILLAHPSAHGLSSGSGLSGSTHWNNAVRSRLYFQHADGDDADPDERTLTCLKANYARKGSVLRVRWVEGIFKSLDPPGGIDRIAASAKADRVFMALLASTYGMSVWVSPNPNSSRNYAPMVFSKHPDREGIAKQAFETAMFRLMKVGRIKTETYGKPSEPRTRLAI